DDVKVFQAGTKQVGDDIVTSGGRVLCVTALGETVEDARNKAYEHIKHVNFDGMFYRKDIAWRAINRK
ncbi:MAG: phosphoribosylamine--glycine ligase, partial [Succinivibrio sp.]|nr:phosphoribosylamine--glycine ligase [Succinivibrio sp.]